MSMSRVLELTVVIALHSKKNSHRIDNAGFPARWRRSRLSLCNHPSNTATAIMTDHAVTPPLGTSIISARNALTLVGLYLVYYVLRAIYNISPLHPLSRIPGPKLAGATYWPEFYYDVVKNGCYTKEISKMHEKYGETCHLCVTNQIT